MWTGPLSECICGTNDCMPCYVETALSGKHLTQPVHDFAKQRALRPFWCAKTFTPETVVSCSFKTIIIPSPSKRESTVALRKMSTSKRGASVSPGIYIFLAKGSLSIDFRVCLPSTCIISLQSLMHECDRGTIFEAGETMTQLQETHADTETRQYSIVETKREELEHLRFHGPKPSQGHLCTVTEVMNSSSINMSITI